VEAYQGQYRLQKLIADARAEWGKMDVLLLPTAGTTYTIEQIQADPVALNSNLGHYTNFVNLMDLAAVAVPAGFLPSGLRLPTGRCWRSQTAFTANSACPWGPPGAPQRTCRMCSKRRQVVSRLPSWAPTSPVSP
jgi:Asp-tRNA(Asn)/Glu-tRNA(Gln) amidotransferase A subunit family amidase